MIAQVMVWGSQNTNFAWFEDGRLWNPWRRLAPTLEWFDLWGNPQRATPTKEDDDG